jgi:hypothetical protein
MEARLRTGTSGGQTVCYIRALRGGRWGKLHDIEFYYKNNGE